MTATLVFVISIGSPLLGLRVFHGTDLLLDRTPWRTTPAEQVQATNPVVQDTVSTFMPLHAEVQRRLAHGDFPMWTPLPAGGLPLGTVTDEGTFGPLNVAYRIVPLWYAPGLTKLLEVVVASGFTFLFLRRLGVGRPAAVLGGLIFAMSGFQVVWTNWPQSHVGALIPAVFWSVERAIQVGTLRGALPIVPAVAALVLEGFPSVAGYGLLAAAAYAVVRLAVRKDSKGAGRLRAGAPLAVAGALGLGLTLFQLLPLADRAAQLDLAYREQGPGSHLPLATTATLAIPDAFGSPVDGSFFGPLNYVEIQGFIGASALVLVAAAGAWPIRTPRGSRSFLWAAVGVAGVLLYVGGPVLAAFQVTDLFGLNFVTRLRSVLGFLLACLAGLGLQAVADRADLAPDRRLRAVAVWSGAIVIGGFGLLGIWRVGEQAGRSGFVLRQAALPLAAAALTGICAFLATRRRSAPLAMWVIPAIFAAEALTFAVPFWPRVPREDFYPTTRAHRLTEARLGRDRLVGAGGAMYPGTTTYYGLRSLTANSTLPQLPAWEELVRSVDADAFERSPVYPGIGPRWKAAVSPVLDRLAVRYFFTPPTVRAFGRLIDVAGPAGDPIELEAGDEVVASIPGGPIRAVLVDVLSASGLGEGSRLVADVTGKDALGRGFQLLYPSQAPGEVQVPVVEPCGASCPERLVLRLRFEGRGRVILAGDRRGGPATSLIVAEHDGLRLDLVENVIGYRRWGAVPRVRWAGMARVEPDPAERVRLLAGGLPAEEIVLTDPGPAGSGRGAELEVLEDSGDSIRVTVSADGEGYVVVADPLQHGWVAEVDGSPAPLRAADHAVVAVLVPAGTHSVALRYDPPGWDVGLLISALSLLTVIVLLLWTVRRGPGVPPGHRPPREMLLDR